jgi:anaerobic ribonucleoside-triphosphate reductase activating protein
MLRVASIVDDTEAEGPGRRWALWLQGCPIRCAGCCNPDMFDAGGGHARAIDELEPRIPASVEGITLLGGEPFAQACAAAELARRVRARGLTVMVFSGYTLAELRADGDDAAELLAATDLLVDGRYDRSLPEPPPPIGRRWIGSTNQTMHFLTAAYAPDDPRLRAANTIEIRLTKDGLSANGWPTLQALARRPRP